MVSGVTNNQRMLNKAKIDDINDAIVNESQEELENVTI